MSNGSTNSQREITIVGIVKEIGANGKTSRIGIKSGNEMYRVKQNEEGNNLFYEVGNKVEATGIISRTKDGLRRIDVTGYEVFEMDEDDPDYSVRDEY